MKQSAFDENDLLLTELASQAALIIHGTFREITHPGEPVVADHGWPGNQLRVDLDEALAAILFDASLMNHQDLRVATARRVQQPPHSCRLVARWLTSAKPASTLRESSLARS